MRKRLWAFLIVLLLGLAPGMHAQAEAGFVTTTGNVNIRSGPGLGYGIQGSVPKGSILTYAGETSTDERGVAWYKIEYSGLERAWISSVYSFLTLEEATDARVETAPEPVLILSPNSTGAADADALRGLIEAAAGTGCQLWPGDYDGDGALEAFALAGKSGEFGPMELWYTDGSAAWKVSVSNGMGFEKTSTSYKTGSGMIFCAVDGYTSTSISQLWYIENGRPTSADSGGLGEVRQYGDSDFTFVSDAYDLGMDGTGHT